MGNPLPWDTDIDIGLMSDELKRINQEQLFQAFKGKNISIGYRIWLGSFYVERGDARGDLMVFQETRFNEIWRTGLEPYVLYLHHSWYHKFPAELIERPLPKVRFAGVEISVPRKKWKFKDIIIQMTGGYKRNQKDVKMLTDFGGCIRTPSGHHDCNFAMVRRFYDQSKMMLKLLHSN